MPLEPIVHQCPKGHGPLQRRAIEQRIFEGGRRELIAVWVCPTCGHHHVIPATEFDEASLICDFCSQPDVVRVYPCETFAYRAVGIGGPQVVMSQLVVDEGDWLACAECARLVDANDRTGLTQRSLKVLASHHGNEPGLQRVLGDTLRQIHEQFFLHRKP